MFLNHEVLRTTPKTAQNQFFGFWPCLGSSKVTFLP